MSDERTVWQIFFNAPGPEAVALLAEATKILIARNLIKPKRERAKKPVKVKETA